MEIKTGKGTKENHVFLDLPENMGQEKIILTQKENIAKKRNKESRKKKDTRKNGNNPVKFATRKWIIIQVQLLMQI